MSTRQHSSVAPSEDRGRPPASRPRVLLADDSSQILGMWRSVLALEFEVVDAVGDGLGLVEASRRLVPDAIVTDVAMPGLDGIRAATRVLETHPGIRIVFATVHTDAAIAKRCLATGALGYVVKAAGAVHLVPAVRAVLRGERYIVLTPDAPVR